MGYTVHMELYSELISCHVTAVEAQANMYHMWLPTQGLLSVCHVQHLGSRSWRISTMYVYILVSTACSKSCRLARWSTHVHSYIYVGFISIPMSCPHCVARYKVCI